MKNRGDKWSENEISLAKELYQKGLIISDIAPKVNHTDTAVIKKLKELGLTGNLDLVQNIHSILVKEIGVNPEKKLFKYEHTAQLYRLELNQTETIALYYWLQKNGISLMERKNKLIEEFINERVKIPA